MSTSPTSTRYCGSIFFSIETDRYFRILGPQSDKHASVLPTALLFAQDYSILAASLEDRPFVPVGNVLMPGFFPRDLKAVFRGWRDEVTESFKEGRKEGKKVLGLGAAIAAVRQ